MKPARTLSPSLHLRILRPAFPHSLRYKAAAPFLRAVDDGRGRMRRSRLAMRTHHRCGPDARGVPPRSSAPAPGAMACFSLDTGPSLEY
jgi:hypothetical protein